MYYLFHRFYLYTLRTMVNGNEESKMKKRSLWLLAAIVLMIPLAAGCGENQITLSESPRPNAAPAVEIAEVAATSWADSIELPGRIVPVRQAVIRAQVPGIVLSRNFEEGSHVQKDQILFRIDPNPYEAALAKAEASLATARANLFRAEAEVKRNKPLLDIGAVSPRKYDADLSCFKLAKAAKMAALADIKTARINLGYTKMTAPISGRIGRSLVSEGDLVGQDEATEMALIQQLNPIYADFTQPVSEYLQMKHALDGRDAQVEIFLEEIGYRTRGKLLFSDVTVDRSTGQVTLRSQFPNPDVTLLPNMFVRIRAILATDPEAIFIPQRALSMDSNGTATVMVVDARGLTRQRAVTLGKMNGSLWRVRNGLAPGERIVTTGADKVRPGMSLDTQATEADNSVRG